MKFIKSYFPMFFFLGIGLFFYIIATSSLIINRDSFFYPRILSLIFLAFTILLGFHRENNQPIKPVNWIGIFTILLYIGGLYLGGFLIATVLFLGVSLSYLGEKNKKIIVIFTLSITSVIYIIFKFVFNVPILGGILW
ncbi:MAG: tripartite tricarboxylate transporter TctB family protein [Brevinema sp.]